MEAYYQQLPPLSKYNEEDTSIQAVQVDGLVVLKIMKHANENLPQPVTGQLLGLDAGPVLEVTHSFPFPQRDETQEEKQDDSYHDLMMNSLRKINVAESTIVGWYSSPYMGSSIDAEAVKDLFSNQQIIKKYVHLIYDPWKTRQGNLSLKAYRFNQKFLQLYENQTFNKESISRVNFSFSEIFDEYPLTVTNTSLVNAFLFELQESNITDLNFKELDLSTTLYLEKNIELLAESFDELAQQQNAFGFYQRSLAKQQLFLQKRRAENAARKLLGQEPLPEEDTTKPEPSRLEYLLIANQIEGYCKQVDRFAANNLSKLFLQSSVWKN